LEIRTIVGGDFNSRTGKLGGRWESGMERGEEGGRRSRDKKVNREGRYLVEALEEAGWFIFKEGKGEEKEMRRGNGRTRGEEGSQQIT